MERPEIVLAIAALSAGIMLSLSRAAQAANTHDLPALTPYIGG